MQGNFRCIVEAVWYLARDHTNWFSTVDYNMESVRKVKLAIQQYSSRVTKMVSDHNIDLYLDFKSIKGSVKLSEIMKSLVNCEPVLRYWSWLQFENPNQLKVLYNSARSWNHWRLSNHFSDLDLDRYLDPKPNENSVKLNELHEHVACHQVDCRTWVMSSNRQETW